MRNCRRNTAGCCFARPAARPWGRKLARLPRCGALEDADWATSPAGCPACHNLRLRFQTVIPLGPYDGALRDAVLKTKRSYHEQMSLALGQLLLRRRERELNDFHPDLVVPIPMHWTRRFRRGINSPELLAGCLGRRLRVPVADWLLVRTRNTLPQKDLTPQDRFRNVRGAFRVRRGRRRRLQGSRVLLVDDILTTGATCSEAAAVLRRCGRNRGGRRRARPRPGEKIRMKDKG